MGLCIIWLDRPYCCSHSFRHNSKLQTLDLVYNRISKPVQKSVDLEMVLCQLRNAQVTEIDALDDDFDDADAIRIAEALKGCA